MLAEFTIGESREIPVVRIGGEIDASNVNDLRQSVIAAVSNRRRGMVLDLTDVTYLDSAAIQLVFDLARRLGRRQLGIRIVRAPDSFVADVLEAVGARDVAPISPDVGSAIEELLNVP